MIPKVRSIQRATKKDYQTIPHVSPTKNYKIRTKNDTYSTIGTIWYYGEVKYGKSRGIRNT